MESAFFICGFAAKHYLCTNNREDCIVFIRLVVKIGFKVKIMLLDFQTTMTLALAVIATILSIYTLTQTNFR